MSKLGFDLGVGSAIPKYQDLTFIGDFPTRNSGRFKLIGLLGESTVSVGRSFDKNEVSTNNAVGTAADFSSRLSIFAFTHNSGLGEKGRVKSSLSFQPSITNTRSDTIDYDHKTYFRQYAGEMNESKLTAATQLKYKLNAKNSLVIGADVAAYITNYHDSVWDKTNNRFLILDKVDNKQRFLVQSSVELLHRFSDLLILNVGIHYQYLDLNNERVIEPRLSVKWQFSENQSINIGYGLHSQILSRLIYYHSYYDQVSKSYQVENSHLKFTQAQPILQLKVYILIKKVLF